MLESLRVKYLLFMNISSFFNDVFVFESECLENLNMDVADIVVLQIIDYRLTIEKLKEMLTTVKPMIVDLIKRYELSGMGALNRDSSADDWGSLISLYASKETTERNSFVNIIIFTYCTGGMFWREIKLLT